MKRLMVLGSCCVFAPETCSVEVRASLLCMRQVCSPFEQPIPIPFIKPAQHLQACRAMWVYDTSYADDCRRYPWKMHLHPKAACQVKWMF